MPALAVLAAGADRFRPVIFDADGLAVDERVDFAGLSPRGLTYRVLRDIEAQMVRRSASVMVRSPRAADILRDRAGPPIIDERFHVVSNGRDEKIFMPGDDAQRTAVRGELGIADDAPVIAYAGSVGAQYRFDEFGRFARSVLTLRPNTRLLVLTAAIDHARSLLAETGAEVVDASVIKAVRPGDVARHLACADVGVAYRQPSFSMAAVAPIKIGEYLLCGLPVVGAAAVGDTQRALDAGVFRDGVGDVGAAADWFVRQILPDRATWRERARTVGMENFSLARAVQDYGAALAPLSALTLQSPRPVR
jgi:glycosyltransferase involved in cell wall biosynthesis